MKRIVLSFITILFSIATHSQQSNLGINTTTPDASATLEVVSANNNQGVLFPRLTDSQRQSISNPANGLLLYNTNTKSFWYFNGTNWLNLDRLHNQIIDMDLDTYVKTSEGINTTFDSIVFSIDGIEQWVMVSDRLESSSENIFIGEDAGLNNTSFAPLAEGVYNTIIGQNAGKSNQTGSYNLMMGYTAGPGGGLHSGDGNVFLGAQSAINKTSGNKNVMIGVNSGGLNSNGEKNVFLGAESGYNETGSNKLYIENSIANADNALIYGEFDNNILRVNGELQLGSGGSSNRYKFPTADGTTDQVLATNGSGQLSWITPSVGSIDKIEDSSDMDTSIKTIEGTSGGDTISFSIDGLASWQMIDNRLFSTNTQNNTLIGKAVGAPSGTGINNTLIGASAGTTLSTGHSNTLIGLNAGAGNNSGDNNIYMGSNAGALSSGSSNIGIGNASGHNASGTDNVFLGHYAGFSETNSNKLYIENSNANADNALIYGEFDTNILRINGELQLGSGGSSNRYKFPTADGTTDQVLTTNGNGQLSWATTSTNKIEDSSDMDTYIEAIEGTSGLSDTISFNINGNSYWQMIDTRLQCSNPWTNTLIGNQVGVNLSNGQSNTIIGDEAGKTISNGDVNTFIGFNAGYTNSTGSDNVVIGGYGGYQSNGDWNTFVGRSAGYWNSMGDENVYIGGSAGYSSDASWNTFVGQGAGYYNTTGVDNVFLGWEAGFTNTTGSNLVCIGENSDVATDNLSNAMALGESTTVNASNKVRIGNSGITVIEGQVDWSFPSDGRFKREVQEDVKGLDFILGLRPVSYEFDKKAFDDHRQPSNNNSKEQNNKDYDTYRQTGFIAQEVETLLSELSYDFDGLVKPSNPKDNYGIRYGSFVVPITKAIQEQQEIIKEQERQINELKTLVNQLAADLRK